MSPPQCELRNRSRKYAAGGVLGKKLQLDVEDDACDPKQARSVAEKIGGAKIPFVAGHYLCAAVTNWAMERRRGAGAGGVKTVQWLG